MEIFQLQAPCDAFGQALNKLMIAYNMEKLGDVGTTATLNLGQRDYNGGEVEGGLRGEMYWNWLIIYQLVIPQDARGTAIGVGFRTRKSLRGRMVALASGWTPSVSKLLTSTASESMKNLAS
jgi:hypothetical protein